VKSHMSRGFFCKCANVTIHAPFARLERKVTAVSFCLLSRVGYSPNQAAGRPMYQYITTSPAASNVMSVIGLTVQRFPRIPTCSCRHASAKP
jgi:hypothetical protein